MQRKAEHIPDKTNFEEGEYMINVPQDIFKFNFLGNINQSFHEEYFEGSSCICLKKWKGHLDVNHTWDTSKSYEQFLSSRWVKVEAMKNAVLQMLFCRKKHKSGIDPSGNDDSNLPYSW